MTGDILLVDDEAGIRKVLGISLSDLGYTVHAAENAAAALTIIEAVRPSIILTDIKMPGMDGIELLRRIKADHPLVEVIMLTGHSTLDSAINGLKLGAFDYLTKPCDISELILKLKAAHEKRMTALDKIQKAKIDRIISDPMEAFVKD
jgi:DNA-binding NtrC family response regulator